MSNSVTFPSSLLKPQVSQDEELKFLLTDQSSFSLDYLDYRSRYEQLIEDLSPEGIKRVWSYFPLDERRAILGKIGREDCEKIPIVRQKFKEWFADSDKQGKKYKPCNYLFFAKRALPPKKREENLYLILGVFLKANLRQKNERAKRILQTALSCKPIKKLYDLARSTYPNGNITVSFMENSENEGASYIETGQIVLGSDLSDEEALSAFVFELTNCLQRAKLAENNSKATDKSCEDWVREIEKIEFEGALIHHEVMAEGIKIMGLSPKLDEYASLDGKDFERDYEEYQKFTDHANYYREQWRRLTGKSSSDLFLFEPEEHQFILAEENNHSLDYLDYKKLYEQIVKDPSQESIRKIWFSFPVRERKAILKKRIGKRELSVPAKLLSTQDGKQKVMFSCLGGFLKAFLKYQMERAEVILQKALSCTRIKKLYDQAKLSSPTGNISVSFVEGSNFEGFCYPKQGKITLNSELSDEKALVVLEAELAKFLPKRDLF
jgi:hypothetical protein